MLAETVHAPALLQVPANAGITFFVIISLVAAGLLVWLVAAVLGFARARAFRPSTRWFALSALFVLLYHLYLVAFSILGAWERDVEKLLSIGAFFNLWIVLGGICAIIGFLRLTNPRP